ncbi:MAG: S8 family serine peptidase [Lachnospiraceae bacterium]|nr:S8 family serine peptidase [Lachnospiraceae bacterium]
MRKRLVALLLAVSMIASEGSVSFAASVDAGFPEAYTETVEDGDLTEIADAIAEEVVEESVADEAVVEEIVAETVSPDETTVTSEEESQSEAEDDTAIEAEDDETEAYATEAETETETETEAVSEVDEVSEYADMFEGMNGEAKLVLSSSDKADKKTLVKYKDTLSLERSGIDYIENEIIVSIDNESQAYEYAKMYSGAVKDIQENYALIELNADPTKNKATVKDAVAASMLENSVLPAAWPNNIRRTFAEPFSFNDPALKVTSSNYQWFHDLLGSKIAWDEGYTGEGVSVTVIDTGVCYSGGTHEDLNIWGAYDRDNCHPNEPEYARDLYIGHGTHVCGLVGAKINNGVGGSGIAPGCDLSSINAATIEEDADGKKYATFGTWDLINSITYARTIIDTDIINMSLGGYSYNEFEAEAVKECYDEGIAVFVAAGNEDTTSIAYPAGYKGAIAIAAIDQCSQKTDFSNHAGPVDWAFPGQDIYSTYNESASSYTFMDGTSMACPIASGTAAVILGYARKNDIYTETETYRDVDNLIKLMKKGAVKANGSGLGAGYVNIPKALGLSTATTKPGKLAFSVKSGTTFKSESADIVISGCDYGCTVYYSYTGKLTYKNGVVDGFDDWATGKGSVSVTIPGNKSVTLSAIAVNNASGLASPIATATYKFNPYPTKVEVASELGVKKVVPGSKHKLTAVVSPSYVKDASVVWESDSKDVTISKTGVMSVAPKASAGTFKVRARSKLTGKNGDPVYSPYMTFTIVDNNPVTKLTAGKKSVTITSKTDIVEIPFTMIKKDGSKGVGQVDLGYRQISGDVPNTVNISLDTIRIGYPSGYDKTGTSVFEFYTKDGSGLSVTVKVNNKVPVIPGQVKITGNDYLAAGKSIKLTAEFTPANATDKNVIWSVEDNDGKVTIDSKGTLKASKDATNRTYVIRATMKNNTLVTKTKVVNVVAEKVKGITLGSLSNQVFRVTNEFGAKTSATIPVTLNGGNPNAWKVTSSNTDILMAFKTNSNTISINSMGTATGKVKVDIVTTDGTNLKKSITVEVLNPATSLAIGIAKDRCNTVAYGKTMKLGVAYGQGKGVVNKKNVKLKWTSSDESAFTVDANGTVKAKTWDSKSAVITATALDGSGLSASIKLYTCDTIKSLTPYYFPFDYYLGLNLYLLEPGDYSNVIVAEYTTTHGGYPFGVIDDKYIASKAVNITSSSAIMAVADPVQYTDGFAAGILCARNIGSGKLNIKMKNGDSKKCSWSFLIEN